MKTAVAALPVSSVVVSAAARLAYVLRHFQLAYPGAPTGSIGYAESRPQIEVSEQSDGFFKQHYSYPPAPNWREWQGRRIPFFFDNSPEVSLLLLEDNQAFIGADIISGAFYLLSGWQEYFSAERDQHGRFPYSTSVQKQFDFIALPVVNYYFDVLRAAIEHVSGQRLTPRRWGAEQAEFAGFVSHDVDNLRGGWGEAARAAWQRGAALELIRLAGSWLRGRPAPWANLAAVRAATARYDAPTTFFVLPRAHPAANGTANADYDIQSAEVQAQLRTLAASGAEIACHGSYDAATDARELAADQQAAGAVEAGATSGNRFHYLRWEPTSTPQLLAAAGIGYDSTLGFAEHFGFRNSYCLPFYPFDFARQTTHEFLEIPLVVMDTTLHHPAYLQLSADELVPALEPVFAEIKKFGGVASMLWHNQNFSPANTRNGPAQFHQLMTHLQQLGARFYTGAQLTQEIKNDQ